MKPKKLKEDEMEGSMHRTALAILIQDAQDLLTMIKDSDDLPEWLESKITKAKDYIAGSKNYMVGQVARAQGALEEKAVSKAQQRFMGMVKNCKETGDCPSSEVEKAADSMTGKEVDDFAGTKHKGLPNKKEELRNRVRETIVRKLNEECCGCSPEPIEEAEYKGKKVTLNDPIRTSGESKKFKVYVKNDKGNVVVVRFGDPDMEIRRDNPEARKNFRKRHDCANKKDKTTAGYWSCWQWRAGAKVDS